MGPRIQTAHVQRGMSRWLRAVAVHSGCGVIGRDRESG